LPEEARSPAGRGRRVTITERRTKVDWALQIKELVDVDFPHAEKIVLVMDNLNTHKIASLYEAFPPEEAKRIREKLERKLMHGTKCAIKMRAKSTGDFLQMTRELNFIAFILYIISAMILVMEILGDIMIFTDKAITILLS
jgi:hypothetical protein